MVANYETECYNLNMIAKKNEQKSSWPLVGNRHIVDFLSRSIANNKVASAYIFFGPQDLGKTTLANFFAKTLLCQNKGKQEKGELLSPCENCASCRAFNKNLANSAFEKEDSSNIAHGDFHFVKREEDKKNISIEQIRTFINDLGLSSFFGSYKVGIIKEAESLSIEAANALLKTLEEPKEKVVIVLVADNLESIPSTIISRCQVLNFYPVKTDIIYDYLVEEKKVSRGMAKNFSRICLGRPALATKFLEDKDFYKDYLEKANIFLSFGGQDINERLEGMGKLIGPNAYGQEYSQLALKILEIWQGVARDMLLLDFGQENLIQNHVFFEELSKQKLKFGRGVNEFLKIIKNFEKGKKYIKANVNPRLVLENIAVNI
jgi:DNA polymerase-3 subunit delta'